MANVRRKVIQVKTDPELTQMSELVHDDMKALTTTMFQIFKKLNRDMAKPEREQRGLTLCDFKVYQKQRRQKKMQWEGGILKGHKDTLGGDGHVYYPAVMALWGIHMPRLTKLYTFSMYSLL